ncbi:hypothetical protein SAMN05444414_106153 [Roseovarius marisflavi]|uniref:Uncharacterized protein n=1 Tax=Roseovarius marisflavi TaxID=1054996 RepID=A0A1M6YF67_9RHOB|nr:hypothetical protein [Roseovarius marisflavi]SHL16946.1 hypothetical protein SAMN05444414_106153 [Roseovarius marisflavi]
MRQAVYLAFCLLAVACSDPLDQIPRLSGEDLADDPPQVGLVQRPDVGTGGGFLARLLRGDEDDTASAAAEVTEAAPAPDREAQFASLEGDEAMHDAAPIPEQAVAPERQPKPDTRIALAETLKPETPKGGGFLSFLRPATPTAAASTSDSEIAPGTVLPYGQAARICGLAPRDMGKRVQQYPEKRPVYALYDSDPRDAGPHSFYITGFDDGCAQQFTASLVMFGSVGLHEQLRYGLPAKVQPYSDTDKAYETIKSKVCRVGRKTPCGASLSRLERNTVFITIYKNFGGNTEWSEMLLHDRKMIALSHKGG